jgi:hypothetical protein
MPTQPVQSGPTASEVRECKTAMRKAFEGGKLRLAAAAGQSASGLTVQGLCFAAIFQNHHKRCKNRKPATRR